MQIPEQKDKFGQGTNEAEAVLFLLLLHEQLQG